MNRPAISEHFHDAQEQLYDLLFNEPDAQGIASGINVILSSMQSAMALIPDLDAIVKREQLKYVRKLYEGRKP